MRKDEFMRQNQLEDDEDSAFYGLRQTCSPS
jgi:hypothetical protein